jgi:hypothetical protein
MASAKLIMRLTIGISILVLAILYVINLRMFFGGVIVGLLIFGILLEFVTRMSMN